MDKTDLKVLFIYSGEELEKLREIVRLSGYNVKNIYLFFPRKEVLVDYDTRTSFCDIFKTTKEVLNGSFESFQAVVFVPSELNQLAKCAGLIDDTPDIKLTLYALKNGKKVSLIPVLVDCFKPFSKKIKSYLDELASLGIDIIGFDNASAAEPHACSQSSGECSACGYCFEHIPGKVKDVITAGADRIASTIGVNVKEEVASLIDHTLLKADATRQEVLKLCDDAIKYSFASVCVNPSNVKLASERLTGSPVKVCTVVGFPLGATTTTTKVMETRDAIANGATEIDMVINVGALKAKDYELVKNDIAEVVKAANGAVVKVILETSLLTDDEKVKACLLAKEAGSDFVKTSTGFSTGGATVRDIELMRKTVGKYMGVKASGGIRDFQTAQKMIKAGATRIGASASVSIVKGEQDKTGVY